MVNREIINRGQEQVSNEFSVSFNEFRSNNPDILRKTSSAMCRWAIPVVGINHAEDVAQETWISVTRRFDEMTLDQIKHLGDNIADYLHTATINAGKMFLRSYKRRIAREQKASLLNPGFTKTSENVTELPALAKEAERVLRSGMDNDDYVDIFLSVERDDLSWRETADRLDITRNRVKGVLSRHRPTMIKILKQYEEN